VLEFVRFACKGVQQAQFALVGLKVEHLQLVGQALSLLGGEHFGVVFTTHQDHSLVLHLGIVDQGEALGGVLVVHLVGQERSEVHGIGGKLQHDELKALAAGQR